MKNKFCLIIVGMALFLGSCDKYDSGITEAESYKNVYMPRAARDSTVLSVTRDENTFELPYSAYLGGVTDASEDISISFTVDEAKAQAFNTKYGTNYPMLPAANYNLGATSAVIKSGQRSTENMTLTIKSNEDLSLFKTYILPVSISAVNGSGSKPAEEYTTTYYLVKVGQEEILNLGNNWGGIYSLGPKNTIISNDKNSKDILMYLPNAEGKYTQPPLHIGIFWEASEQFFYVNENSMVVRNIPPYSGLFNFVMYPENIVQTNPKPAENIIVGTATGFWMGDQWNQYVLVPFRSYFLTIDKGGTLWRQAAYTFVNTNRTQIRTGFNFTKAVAFPSKNPTALLCLNAEGDLWYFPTSELGVPGEGKKVGSGWNVFKQIIVSDNDILAVSASTNGIYRLPFDPDKNYNF